MSTTKSFLGKTKDRNKAFPGIKSLSVTVTQDPYQNYRGNLPSTTHTYSSGNITRYSKCNNSKCQQGGIDLQQAIYNYGNGRHILYCGGHEGTPKGRKKGPLCNNVFTIEIKIEKEK